MDAIVVVVVVVDRNRAENVRKIGLTQVATITVHHRKTNTLIGFIAIVDSGLWLLFSTAYAFAFELNEIVNIYRKCWDIFELWFVWFIELVPLFGQMTYLNKKCDGTAIAWIYENQKHILWKRN